MKRYSGAALLSPKVTLYKRERKRVVNVENKSLTELKGPPIPTRVNS